MTACRYDLERKWMARFKVSLSAFRFAFLDTTPSIRKLQDDKQPHPGCVSSRLSSLLAPSGTIPGLVRTTLAAFVGRTNGSCSTRDTHYARDI